MSQPSLQKMVSRRNSKSLITEERSVYFVYFVFADLILSSAIDPAPKRKKSLLMTEQSSNLLTLRSDSPSESSPPSTPIQRKLSKMGSSSHALTIKSPSKKVIPLK
jgi:hypothetical protein